MTENPIIESMSHEELVKLVVKLQTKKAQAVAELEGKKAYCEQLNRERRPIALENRRLKEELDKAIKRYESLKARVKESDPKFQF